VDSGILENSALALGVNCRRGVLGTVELLMIGGDTLVYDDYDAFGLLQRVRVRLDDGRVLRIEFTFLDDSGTTARTFPMSRDTMLFHEKMEGARKALIEVRTYSEGKSSTSSTLAASPKQLRRATSAGLISVSNVLMMAVCVYVERFFRRANCRTSTSMGSCRSIPGTA